MTAEAAAVNDGRGGPQVIPRPPGTVVGDPAPWIDVPAPRRRLSLEEACDALAASGPARSSAPEDAEPSAAVLAPLYEDGGETWVVLTRRAWTMRSHTGEVSFPGGRREPAESLWETATRESREEIALDPGLVVPVGELDHLATITQRRSIVPFVGLLPDGRPELVPEPAEVDAILHVPLSELLDPAVYRQERWNIAGVQRPMHFFELVGDTVWGATGSMLFDLLTRITGTRHRAGRIR